MPKITEGIQSMAETHPEVPLAKPLENCYCQDLVYKLGNVAFNYFLKRFYAMFGIGAKVNNLCHSQQREKGG